ncbi:MAG TPA: shikimate kinase [Mycobacteriales bacterium]|nr:shikimate kinase [Mycobacteriales bacterium]
MERVVLVGMMGAGKTTVGRALAARLGRPYVDNDALLQAAHGAPAAVLLARDGAGALHAAEAAVLRAALAASGPAVVAAPGSAVLDPALRSLLAGEYVVWLRARPETLAARVVADPARPFLHADPLTTVTALAAEREPGFAAVADAVVDVDGLAVADVVEEIAARLGR